MVQVLGLSFGFHDSAAALIRDGEIIAAAQQERFSRRKNDARFPADAMSFCLDQAGIDAAQLDLVAYHEGPLAKLNGIASGAVPGFPHTMLGLNPSLVVETRHHISHAASAFFCSPFDEAAVITIDGVGEYETGGIFKGEGCDLTQTSTLELPHSLGLFYSAFTGYLGFPVNEGEYKVMGMAAFGKPIWKDKLLNLFKLLPDGRFTLDQNMFSFATPEDIPYTSLMIEVFGPARKFGAPFAINDETMPDTVPVGQRAEIVEQSLRFADIAASVQACTEEVILHVVRRASEHLGCKQICLAGGVGLNSLANGRVLRETGLDLFIQPAAGDAGCALGAAAYHWHRTLGGARMAPMRTAALGRSFTRPQADDALASSGFQVVFAEEEEGAWLDAVADLIAGGQVVGWFSGRAEWGPRALGHRSIFVNPGLANMQRKINEMIKFREPFRPFAPAVPVERAAEFFEIPDCTRKSRPEDYMLAVHNVRPEWKDRLPAITHADGTARVQTISADTDPMFHRLLFKVGERTGIPIVLNTSFNLNGEPIVDTPADAIRTFALSGLDFLCIENRILSKKLAS